MHIGDYANEYADEFYEVRNELTEVHALKRYLEANTGLDELAFTVVAWAKREGLLEDKLQPVHFALLLVQFGIGHLRTQTDKFLQHLDLDDDTPTESYELQRRGEFLLEFFVSFDFIIDGAGLSGVEEL